jgi:biotin carboxyl carrier protein
MQGSQLPPEARLEQLMKRIENISGADSLASLDPDTLSSLGLQATSQQQTLGQQDFKSMVQIMQHKMMAETFMDSNNDSDSGGMGSMMQGLMMGSNPKMMQLMAGSGMQTEMMQGMPGISGMMDMQMPSMQGMNRGYATRVSAAQMPVQGRISSHFGERPIHPVHGEKTEHNFHYGMDIAAERGTPIKAPWSGKVVYVGPADGFGSNTVIIAHPETEQPDGSIIYSVFGHNEEVFVKEGNYVQQGEAFATVGSDGDSTGPHLHWETRMAQSGLRGLDIFKKFISMAIDPLKFV